MYFRSTQKLSRSFEHSFYEHELILKVKATKDSEDDGEEVEKDFATR
jgi:hypothetical protein